MPRDHRDRRPPGRGRGRAHRSRGRRRRSSTCERRSSARASAIADVRQLLLTHIHLDHAGVTGTLVRENPAIEVFVHERGAPHMIDPVEAAREREPALRPGHGAAVGRVPGRARPIGSACSKAGSGSWPAAASCDVAYTPGHASHHVSYFDPSSRIAFVGDTAGIRRGGGSYVMPPTPPPDIDLEPWRTSEDRILAWDPDTLFLTHFGPFHGARLHFQELMDRLDEWSRIVTASARRRDTRRGRNGEQHVRRRGAARSADGSRAKQDAEQYSRAGRLDYSWQGLSRYWKKRGIPGILIR